MVNFETWLRGGEPRRGGGAKFFKAWLGGGEAKAELSATGWLRGDVGFALGKRGHGYLMGQVSVRKEGAGRFDLLVRLGSASLAQAWRTETGDWTLGFETMICEPWMMAMAGWNFLSRPAMVKWLGFFSSLVVRPFSAWWKVRWILLPEILWSLRRGLLAWMFLWP